MRIRTTPVIGLILACVVLVLGLVGLQVSGGAHDPVELLVSYLLVVLLGILPPVLFVASTLLLVFSRRCRRGPILWVLVVTMILSLLSGLCVLAVASWSRSIA